MWVELGSLGCLKIEMAYPKVFDASGLLCTLVGAAPDSKSSPSGTVSAQPRCALGCQCSTHNIPGESEPPPALPQQVMDSK